MDNHLYHYTSCETLLDGISETKAIRLSSILDVNVPLDFKERIFRIKQLFRQGKTEEKLSMRDEYSNIVKTKWLKNCKVASFSESNTNSKISGYQLANLWSYYAENHTGVCIVFYKTGLLDYFKKNFKDLHPLNDSVEYQEKLGFCSYNTKYIENQYQGIEENKKTLFFKKLKSWDREQEYRLICFSRKKFEYIPIDGLICEIILGQKTTELYKLKIKNKFPNIKLSKMNYFRGDGEFEKLDVNDSFWNQYSRIDT